MIDHPIDRPIENILLRSQHAAFWSPMWSACAALLVWWSFSFAVNANYHVYPATFLLTFTGGIWLILLGIHLLLRFFAERLKKAQEARTISHLKRAARLVLLLPWGSFLFFFIAAFVGQIYWLGGDVSRLFVDIPGWVFTVILFVIALVHLAMLVLVYGACYSTLRLYFLLRKEYFKLSQKRFPSGIPSSGIDAVLLGFLVAGIGILLYYAILFHDSRSIIFTQSNFHAIAFLDQQTLLGTTFKNELAVFDTTTREFTTLASKIIVERRGSTINGIPVHFFVRPQLADKNRVVVAMQDDFLTLNRLELKPGTKPRQIVYEERLAMFEVDLDGLWCLAIHETGRISLSRFPDTENEEPFVRWIDAPLARVTVHEKTNNSNGYSFYSIPFDFVFLLPQKSDSGQPDIAVVLKEGIYTVRTAPDYKETVRTDLSFPENNADDNERTNCRTFVSPNSKYTLLSVGRWGNQPQSKSVLLDCETGEQLMDLPPLFVSTADTIAFSPDSRMLVAIYLGPYTYFGPYRSGNSTVYVWDIAKKTIHGQPISVPRTIQDVVFSPNGRSVVSPVGGRIHIRRFPGWNRQYSLPLSRMSDNALIGFSPDGTRIFANQYGGVSVLKITVR